MLDHPEILRAILDCVGEGLVVADVFGHIVFANPAATRIFGRDVRSEHLETTIANTKLDRDRASIRLETCPLVASDGTPLGALATFRDSSIEEETEEELVRARAFLDSIVENIPAMIFVKEAEHLRFELFNRAAEKLLHVPRSALLGKNDYDLFPSDQAAFFQAKDKATLDGGVLVDIPEEPIDTPQGRRWLHTKKIPILDEKGRPKYLLGISRDITEQRQADAMLRAAREELELRVMERTSELTRANARLIEQAAEREKAERALRESEEQLRHAQKMEAVGRLAGGVAHDFNNLLTVVLSQVEVLLSDLPRRDPMREELEQIREAAVRGAGLTKQLLAFSRKNVVQPQLVELNSTVQRMQRMLKRLIGANAVLETNLSIEDGHLRADPGLMEQVIVNLVVNARDAMPNGGEIVVTTAVNVDLGITTLEGEHGSAARPYVMLAVRDTGVGMDQETQSRIFEPFFTTKEQGKGTGLGLSTVYGIVEQSGGRIVVKSAPGEGTSIEIYLPQVSNVETEEQLRSSWHASRDGQEVILLVEDEDLVRRAARRALQTSGYRVLEARNATEARTLCETHPGVIHLLLTDLVMPGVGGRELAESFVAIRPDTKVLYMSGYTDDTAVLHGVLARDAAFLEKPFTPETLTTKVRSVLDA